MSSLFDAVIAADNAPAPTSSDAPTGKSRPRGSSRGLPSEGGAPHSDAAQEYPDEEVVGARGTVRRPRPPPGDISKVVDEIGETMVQQFEDFLET
jgi:DNA replication licensing factor MCM6